MTRSPWGKTRFWPWLIVSRDSLNGGYSWCQMRCMQRDDSERPEQSRGNVTCRSANDRHIRGNSCPLTACFDYYRDLDSKNGRKLAIQYRSGVLQGSPVYGQPINLTGLLLGLVDVNALASRDSFDPNLSRAQLPSSTCNRSN